MILFCLGALLYRSRLVPRLIAVWGLTAVLLVTVGSALLLYDPGLNPPIGLYVPYIPFELFIGLWLLVKGFETAPSPAPAGPLPLDKQMLVKPSGR